MMTRILKRTLLCGSLLFFLGILAINNAIASGDKFQPKIDQSVVQKLDEIVTLRRAGKLNEAVKQLEQFTQTQPGYYRAIYNLGLAYADAGKPKEAIATLHKAESLRKTEGIDDATLENSIGWAYLLDKQYSKSDEYFTAALEKTQSLSPASRTRLLNNFGQSKLYQKDYSEAEKYLSLAKDGGSQLATKTLGQVKSIRLSEEKK